MKPAVNRIASVPMTALLCCPHCYRLISYEVGQSQIKCQTCGTTLRNQDLPASLGSSLPD